MSVEEYEKSWRKKIEERSELYEKLIEYLKTGRHKQGLTATDRRQVLRMVSSYHWDDAGKHIFINPVSASPINILPNLTILLVLGPYIYIYGLSFKKIIMLQALELTLSYMSGNYPMVCALLYTTPSPVGLL